MYLEASHDDASTLRCQACTSPADRSFNARSIHGVLWMNELVSAERAIRAWPSEQPMHYSVDLQQRSTILQTRRQHLV